MMNRLGNCKNPHQGPYKRVLCICSAGLLRSPTAAFVLSQEPYNFNTRAAGLDINYALVPVDTVLLHWADEIVCMSLDQKYDIEALLTKAEVKRSLVVLGIPDQFAYRDPELISMIKGAYDNQAKLASLMDRIQSA